MLEELISVLVWQLGLYFSILPSRWSNTVSVLGRDEGCTVKYSPSPEGAPEGEGLYFTVHPESCPNTDSISFLTSIMMITILAVSVSFAPKNFFWLRLNLIINTLSCLNTDTLANDIMIICSVQKMYTNGTTSQGIGLNFTQTRLNTGAFLLLRNIQWCSTQTITRSPRTNNHPD